MCYLHLVHNRQETINYAVITLLTWKMVHGQTTQSQLSSDHQKD